MQGPPESLQPPYMQHQVCVRVRVRVPSHLGPVSTPLWLLLSRVKTRGRGCTAWGPAAKVRHTHTHLTELQVKGHHQPEGLQVMLTLCSCQGTIGGHRLTTTWAPLTGRALEAWSRARGPTGPTPSRASTARRTSMGARSITADQRRAGEPGRGTRGGAWGATGAGGTEVSGATGAIGSPKTDTAVRTTEDAERTGERAQRHNPAGISKRAHVEMLSGSGGGAPAGPQPGATTRTTAARRKATTGTRTWAGPGTTGDDSGRIEGQEEARPEVRGALSRGRTGPEPAALRQPRLPQVTRLTGTTSRCTTARPQPAGSAPHLCKAWTWLRCHPGSAPGRTGPAPGTRATWTPRVVTEVRGD